MFPLLMFIGTATLAYLAATRGPRASAAVCLALSLTVPCFTYQDVGAVRIDLRTGLALVGIACALAHPASRLRYRPLATDFLVAGLVVVQTTSELLTSREATATVVVDIALQWLAPYMLGRIVWQSFDDARPLLRPLVVAACLLSAWSAVESVFRFNPIGYAFGHVGSLQGISDLRWGLRRAEGPVTHPIFFGMELLLLFPFALAAAREARRHRGPQWWAWSPWIVAAGAFFTMSRGPQLGIVGALAGTVALASARRRLFVVVPAVAVLVLAATSGSWIVELFERWSGEQAGMTIEIRGVEYPYTGTRHRFLQLLVYAEAVEHAGWFGYGSTGLRAGETKIPYVEDHLRRMFNSIDNHYLQFVLQNGLAGLGLFVGLGLAAVWYAGRATFALDHPAPWLSAATASVLAATLVLLSSVWLAGDVRFVWLSLVGLAGGMHLSRRASSTTADSAAWHTVPTYRVAGHRVLPGAG